MNQWNRAVVIALVLSIWMLPLSDVVALGADAPWGIDQVKQQIDQFGVGANLKVQLADGKEVQGSLVSLGDDGFALRVKGGDSARYLAYNNVNAVKLANLKYRAKHTPDPVEARRVVLGLGVGHHVQVKTTAGEEYHGNIQAIDPDSFTMLPDHQTTRVQIVFADVQYVEQNLSKGAKIAIIVLASVTVAVIILAYAFGIGD
jgi:ribosome maturation factor RimP